MAWTHTFPEWENEGTTPSTDLQTNGFAGGYKPPASVFNWFWNTAMGAINEIQDDIDLGAVKLRTARTINGTSFNGTANITFGSLFPNAIATNANLNTLTQSGMYYCGTNSLAATLTNSPTTNAFFLLVGRHAGTFQMIVEHSTSGAKMWFRNLYNSVWGSWYEIYTASSTHAAKHGSTGSDPITPAMIGAVPTTRTVNGKALSSNISLTAADVGADASGSSNGVQANLNAHTSNATVHITANERTAWNAKQPATSGLTAETTLADADSIPFYDSSAAANRRTLWSTIKTALNTYFSGLFAAKTHTHNASDISGIPSTDSPTFTGTPAAPTAATGTNTTQIATTAFVNAEIGNDRPYETNASNIKIAGTASVGSSAAVPRADHVHPAQTTIAGNAGTATKLQTARTIAISGGATGTATSFDGSGNVTIPVTSLNPANISTSVPVNKGGTGATTAAAARTNLGAASQADITAYENNGQLGGAVSKSAGENLNNYKTAGVFTFAQSATPVNAPTANGWLIVLPWNKSTGDVTTKQIWIRHGTLNSTTDSEVYIRMYASGTWGNWYKISSSTPVVTAVVG